MTANAERSTTGTEDVESPVPVGRLGPLFAGIWLFFLIEPLADGWALRHELRGVVGMVAVVAFGVFYMWLWWQARGRRRELDVDPPLPVALLNVLALTLLGAVVVACVGETGLACTVYVAVACVLLFPFWAAGPVVVGLTVLTILAGVVTSWGSQVGTAFGVLAASVAVFGLRTVLSRNRDLVRAHRHNANLAVENERTRFARDLHDILGHSLTVITVKAELAQKLFDVDSERARAEIADLERLSRDALADVRRAVEGYRELTLPGELVRARTALGAAEIGAHVPNTTDEVPSDLRELFAWTVREGVTNVIRHSGASQCEILLSERSAEVRDNGTGCPAPDAGGNGLAGLRERAAGAGATVVVRHLSPGFSLSVVRS